MTKPTRVLVGGALVVVAVAAGRLAVAPRAEGGLDCPAPVHDFGRALESDRFRHTFELRNTGSRTVEILAVTSSCGACAMAEPAARTLAPGAAMDLDVDINLRGRSGRQDIRLHVRSDCAVAPLLPLTIRGEAVREVVADPAAVLWHTEAGSGRFEQTVNLVVLQGPAFTVTGIGVSDPVLHAAAPTRHAAPLHPVVIRLDAAALTLPFRGTVTLQTDHPRRRVIEIPVVLMPGR